jgi:hypothetical protein
MPIVDDDQIQIVRATRQGSNNIEINVTWTNPSTGENYGTFGVTFNNVSEARNFLANQTHEDVLRTLLSICINKSTGNLSASAFDALQGKTFRIRQRVVEI